MYRDSKILSEIGNLPLVQKISTLKTEIDSLRESLTSENEQRIIQKFRLEWNYHSNAIEGNPYTYGETVAFLLEGVTAKGKTLKDHLDIKGHDDAIEYLLELIKNPESKLTESDIRSLHKILLKEPYETEAITTEGLPTKKKIQIGHYKNQPNHVKTASGSIHKYASPEDVPILMAELVEWLYEASMNKKIHPFIIAAFFHFQFVAIHPFDDGNGRMARLLMNLILLKNEYPPIIIKNEERNTYYQCLRQADVREPIPFIEYLGGLLINSLNIYIRGAKGESIEETTDLEKEIELFKLSLGKTFIEQNKSEKIIQQRLEDSIMPINNKICNDIKLNFSQLFYKTSSHIVYTTDSEPNKQNKHSFENNTDSLSLLLYFDRSFPFNLGINGIDFDLKALTIEIKMEGFTKSKIPFDLYTSITTKFNQFNYLIEGVSNEKPIEKFYHEKTTQEDYLYLKSIYLKYILEYIKNKTINDK